MFDQIGIVGPNYVFGRDRLKVLQNGEVFILYMKQNP